MNRSLMNGLPEAWGLTKDLARYLALCARRFRAASPAEALGLTRHGFAADKAWLYDAELRHRGLYLSDLERERTARINPLRAILNDKLLFEAYFRSIAPVARSFALVSKGRVLPLNAEWRAIEEGTGPAQIVVKPLDGNRGRGVRLVSLRPDAPHSPQGEQMSLSSLLGQLRRSRRDHLICEFVQQGRFTARLFTESVNTLRFVTMRDAEGGDVFLASAVQRIGSAQTGCRDNFSAGGYSAPVALDSGRLGTAISRQRPHQRAEHHPDSGMRIEGAVVPDWPRLVQGVLDIVAQSPFHYVGWDLVLTDSGFILLEGNNMPDVDLLQVHRPLLDNERVASFFRAHGIIRR